MLYFCSIGHFMLFRMVRGWARSPMNGQLMLYSADAFRLTAHPDEGFQGHSGDSSGPRVGHVTTRAFGLLPCPARVCALLLRIPCGSPTPCGQHADNPKIIAADGSTREHRAYHKGTAVCRVCRLHDDGHLHKPGGAGPACGNSGDVPRSTFAATANS